MTRADLSLVEDIRVTCRRQSTERTLDEHLSCPYCFGTAEDIKSREHARFCDSDPKLDPVVFGFPENFRRYR